MARLLPRIGCSPGTAALAVLGSAACSGPQNALDPRGPAAERIAEIWWVMFGLASIVSVAVTVLLLLAIHRSRQRRAGRHIAEVNPGMLVWSGGVVAPVLILFAVLVYSYRVGASVYPAVDEQDALTVEVIGHQYWWEVRYPEYGVTTANEIHLPAGRRVRFLLRAPDVIHSFWIPKLQGKLDMIPGRVHTLWVEANAPGIFRGQCAEYCGEGHALMAFWVVALQEAQFARWIEQRRSSPSEPAGEQIRRGREIFFAAGCGDCHATRGAPLPEPLGEVGPDLSDLAQRRTLAAGTLPNNRGALASWIADPRRIKPGALMPRTQLAGDELQALLTYLQSLR